MTIESEGNFEAKTSSESERSTQFRMLLVDDDEATRKTLILWISSEFPQVFVETATDTREAEEKLRLALEDKIPFDLVLSDNDLKGIRSGAEIAGDIKREGLTSRFFLMTTEARIFKKKYSKETLSEMGIDEVLDKDEYKAIMDAIHGELER